MANLSYLRRHLQHDPDDDSHHRHRNPTLGPYFPRFSSSDLHDPFPSPEPTNFNIRTLNCDDEDVSDPESVILNGADLLVDRENQVSFVMDLFQQRVEQSQVMGHHSHLVSDSLNGSGFGVIDGGIDNLDLDLGLGFGLDSHENCGFQNIVRNDDNNNSNSIDNDYNDNIVIDHGDDDDDDGVDFLLETRVSGRASCEAESTVSVHTTGIRVLGFGSDFDLEGNENSIAIDLNSGDEYGLDHENIDNDNYVDDDDDDDASVTIPVSLGSLHLEDHRENNDDFEWEEVDGRVDERELLSVFVDDEEASVSLSISPIIAPEDLVSVERVGGLLNLEWEVLLNANNLDANPDHDQDHSGEAFFADRNDYIYTAEYEMLFGQFADNENALMGQPPAAKSVVERLPSIVLKEEDVECNNALCAVCKDEINVGETAKQLPCTHRYHGECIEPWLGIRNTCPVCRYELLTDDADYEQRKAAQRTVATVHGL